MLAHQDQDRWSDLELRDSVLLNDPKHLFVDEFRHDVDGDIEFRRHKHGIQLPVRVVEWEKPNPALVRGWVFAGPFEFGFLGVLEEDGLLRVCDQIILGLETLLREATKRTGDVRS